MASMEPFKIKIESDQGDNPERPMSLKELVAKLAEDLQPMKQAARWQAELKWTQYNELINAGFTKPQALMLIKDDFKM